MAKAIIILMMGVFWAAGAHGADVIVMPARSGAVTFTHKRHQAILKDCMACHRKPVGRIDGFGKRIAHELCTECHKTRSQGPTLAQCGTCHSK